MPNLRLTRRVIDDMPFAASGQILYRDTLLPGFGLRVGSKSKVYFAEGQVNRATRRVTIGRADLFAPEVARKRAQALLVEMANGQNPTDQKRKQAADCVQLAAAFEQFFEARNKLSPHTVSNYGRTAKLYLKAWRKKPMNEITRQMVLAKHQEIAKTRGEVTANNTMRHLRSVYNFIAATQEEFPPNPVLILSQARAWYRERRRQTLVTAVDLPDWWKAVMAEPEYSRDFLLSALFTGMRRGELMKLRWENVDLQSRTLHLPTTKNGDPLNLPLSGFLGELLLERKQRSEGSPWVFPGPGVSGHLVETKKFLLRVSTGSGVTFILADDPQRAVLLDLLRLWRQTLGDQRKTLTEIVALADSNANVRKLVDELTANTRRPYFNARSVGRLLARHLDRVVGGLALRADADSSGIKRYRVVDAEHRDSAALPSEVSPFECGFMSNKAGLAGYCRLLWAARGLQTCITLSNLWQHCPRL